MNNDNKDFFEMELQELMEKIELEKNKMDDYCHVMKKFFLTSSNVN